MVHVYVSKREGLIFSNSLRIEFWTDWSQLKPGIHQYTVLCSRRTNLIHTGSASPSIEGCGLKISWGGDWRGAQGPPRSHLGMRGKYPFVFFFNKSFGILRIWMYIKKNSSVFCLFLLCSVYLLVIDLILVILHCVWRSLKSITVSCECSF